MYFQLFHVYNHILHIDNKMYKLPLFTVHVYVPCLVIDIFFQSQSRNQTSLNTLASIFIKNILTHPMELQGRCSGLVVSVFVF